MTLDFHIDDLAATHARFLRQLSGWGELAILDYARETLPDLVQAVGPESEQEGKDSVTRDILKVVTPVRGGAVSTVSVAQLVGGRRYSGKVRRELVNKHPVRRSDFLSYEASKHRMVGFTAGGYAEAARQLGIQLPGWILDEAGPGDFALERSAGGIRVVLRNEVPWAAYLPGALQRSGYAIQVKSARLYDLAVEAFERAGRESGMKS